MNKIFFFIFILNFKLKKASIKRENCDGYTNDSVKYSYYVKQVDPNSNLTYSFFSNFKEFNDLILECNQTYNITQYVAMVPKKFFILDKSFQLKKIFNQTQINSISSLNIAYLKGIDLNSKAFILNSNRFKQITYMKILYSKMDVYLNSIRIKSDECNLASYDNASTANFFQYSYSIYLIYVSYPSKWCPYFFRNLHLVELGFLSISNSFLIKNKLNFNQLNSSNIYLNYLRNLIFEISYENLNRDNLSLDLFRKITYLGITGIINGIESNLFECFKDLKIINFSLNNLKEFFHMGNEWMNYLNFKINNSDTKKSFRLEFPRLDLFDSFNSFYEYPDEDLCLFKNFPYERLVYPLLLPGKTLKCTCTLFWLQKNLNNYENEIKITYEYNFNDYQDGNLIKVFKFCDDTFNLTVCNFDQRFHACKLLEYNSKQQHHFSFEIDQDILYLIKFVQFILLVILGPVFSFIGLIHNSLIIFVIKNRNLKNEFQESMYKHIIINAIFNIIYCVIMILKLLNTCIFYGPSVYCSNVYQEDWAQSFKIVLIHFLGNATKTCSNASYLIFSISRLLLVEKQHVEGHFNTTNRKPKNIFIFIYVITLILISCILNSFKMFQYRKNSDLNMVQEFPYEIRDEAFCKSETNKFQCQLFNIFKIVNRSLNDLLFVILNILIDLILLVKFKKIMDNKLRQIHDLSERSVIEKSKKSINYMILFNSLIYVFSHLPEFTMTLLLIIYSKKISNFCYYKFSCDLLNEEAEFFCLISIVCQFFILKKFDKHFKRSFKEIKSNLYSFICRKNPPANSSSQQQQHQEIELRDLNNH